MTTQRYCPRCNEDDELEDARNVRLSSIANLVPTVSYLDEDEFVVMR